MSLRRGIMVSDTNLNEFMSTDTDGCFVIGHASVLVRIRGKLILFDPVWGDYKPYGEWWQFVPDQVNCDSVLDRVDACVVSHIHADHFCPDVLRRLKCPVYIMGGRNGLFEEQLTLSLDGRNEYGWCGCPPRRWNEVLPGISIYFVEHDFNTVDSSCFVRSESYCVYVGNDNFLSKRQLREVKHDVERVDAAFVPYAFIHYYPHLLGSLSEAEKALEVIRLNEQSLDQARAFIDTFEPKISVPTGASLFYEGGADHCLNDSLACPQDVGRGSYPLLAGDFFFKDQSRAIQIMSRPEYCEFLKRALGEGKGDPLLIVPACNYPDLVERKKSLFRPPLDHTVIVNGLELSQGRGTTTFQLDVRVLETWLMGEISFEEALGTRRFVYYRTPNIYNLEVIEWCNRWL